ncbi:ATP-binding protein [Rickettsia endosymbiont of Polydrusus tereticollis]|uniref:ATP-binding protein n=1 Tax=Rickettsia endosymbiont of Polydrusus tereticollis TaxID=3066251 RepID=UPI0031331990
MRRVYILLVQEHFASNEQMLFLVGSRQVGKTTIAKLIAKEYPEHVYLNWDTIKDKTLILQGQTFIEEILPLNKLRKEKPLVIFDEIHKFKSWKNYLKGFYDLYKGKYHILVTGSARLDVYQAGGDSLMGRYFLQRIHPLSGREIEEVSVSLNEISTSIEINTEKFRNLYETGGFPEPFLKASRNFAYKWHSLREKQLLYEDIRNLSNIHEISQLETLAELLKEQTGQLLNRTSLSKKIQVSVPTISKWISVLEKFFYCFIVKPWSTNISRSIIKEPKIYLVDWSLIKDEGRRFENFIASHLLKALNCWSDRGLGKYELYFIRNKDGKEVDFLIARNDTPWFLVEAKLSDNNRISDNLRYFQEQTKATHAFQVVYSMEYIQDDCFKYPDPIIVPAITFLSQLV